MFGGYLHLRSLAFVIAPIPYAVVGSITSNVFYEHGTRPITNLALFILVKKIMEGNRIIQIKRSTGLEAMSLLRFFTFALLK